MKGYLLILCLAVCLVAVSESRRADEKRCSKDEDCDENQCCVKPPGPFKGKCQSPKKEGERCFPRRLRDESQRSGCPCEAGLECIGQRPKIGKLPVPPRCRNPNASSVSPDVTN